MRTPRGHWILVDAGPGRGAERCGTASRGSVPATGTGRAIWRWSSSPTRTRTTWVASRRCWPASGPGWCSSPARRSLTRAILSFSTSSTPRRSLARGARGERFTLDSVSFTVLHPDPGWAGWGEDLNEDSSVLLVEYREFQALFAGDAGFPAEAAMARALRPVDLLKVGHHGSRGSTSDEWLASLHPKAAVISVGRNDYGHPSAGARWRGSAAPSEVAAAPIATARSPSPPTERG